MQNKLKQSQKIKIITNLENITDKDRLAIIIGNFMAMEVTKSRIFGIKLASKKLKS